MPSERQWTSERVIAELQAWAAELGRAPRQREATRAGARVWASIAHREFGSWAAALHAAGLPCRAKLRGTDLERACAQAAALRAQGLSWAAIAERRAVAVATVEWRARRHQQACAAAA